VPLASAWAPHVVYRLLTSPVYKGERTYRTKDGRTVTQPAPAIVDAATWARAARILVDHRSYSNRNTERDFLVRGLMRCAQCGALYTTSGSRRRETG
jgi:site-specific DNA recombinase